jgi:hypothetical protein
MVPILYSISVQSKLTHQKGKFNIVKCPLTLNSTVQNKQENRGIFLVGKIFSSSQIFRHLI